MDTLTFINEIVKSISWPLSIIIMVLILRKPIIELPSLIKRLKYKDVEIEFDKKVEELREEAARQFPAIEADESRLKRKRFLIDLAQISPRAAILESWIELETTSMSALKERSIEKNLNTLSPMRLGDLLTKHGILDENKSDIYDKLRNLRNAAVHAAELTITPIIASEYISMADSLTSYIESNFNGEDKP